MIRVAVIVALLLGSLAVQLTPFTYGQSSSSCNVDIVHAVLVGRQGKHVSYNVSDIPQAFLAELCQDGDAGGVGAVVSYSSNSSVVAAFSGPNLSLALNRTSYRVVFENGSTASGNLYTMVYQHTLVNYSISVISIYLNGYVVTEAGYNDRNDTLVGDVYLMRNTSYSGYFSTLSEAVEYMAELYHDNGSLTLSMRYHNIAQSLSTIYRFLTHTVASSLFVSNSMSLVMDSEISCATCEALIYLAAAVGYGLAIYLTFGIGLLLCEELLGFYLIDASAYAACASLGYC